MKSGLKLKLLFIVIFLVADLQAAFSLQVPFFLTNVPSGHFAGVSAPCLTLSEARKSAIHDVVRQVLGAMGTSYGYMAKHHVKGNARGESLQRNIEETLSGTVKGIVIGVEQNIVKSHWSKDISGKFVYFVLVRYPQKMIDEMRRLSKGARLIASVAHVADNKINFKVSEVNGVWVVLNSADITVTKTYRFSRIISLFTWKVPEKVNHNSLISIDPVQICGNSANIRIPLDTLGQSLIDYLLGADFDTIVTLNGYDEIWRSVRVKIAI